MERCEARRIAAVLAADAVRQVVDDSQRRWPSNVRWLDADDEALVRAELSVLVGRLTVGEV